MQNSHIVKTDGSLESIYITYANNEGLFFSLRDRELSLPAWSDLQLSSMRTPGQ